jgi:hypothetical protein
MMGIDDGHREIPFRRQGAEEIHSFTANITAPMRPACLVDVNNCCSSVRMPVDREDLP